MGSAQHLQPLPSEGLRLLQEFTDAPDRDKLIRWLNSMVYDRAIVTEQLIEEERWEAAINPDAQKTAAMMYGSKAFEMQQQFLAAADIAPLLGNDAQGRASDAADVGPRRPGEPAGHVDGADAPHPRRGAAHLPQVRALGDDRGQGSLRVDGRGLPRPLEQRSRGEPAYRGGMSFRPARIDDIHQAALAMPHVTVTDGSQGNEVYQVGQKSFIFFPQSASGCRRSSDRRTLYRCDSHLGCRGGRQTCPGRDPESPFFTTAHFAGHPSVLIRASRLAEVSRDEIVELVQEAWLSQASTTRARKWLAENGLPAD